VAPVIPALGRLRQEYRKFQANLGNIARPCSPRLMGGGGHESVVQYLPGLHPAQRGREKMSVEQGSEGVLPNI
jgi:hypothetical protein